MALDDFVLKEQRQAINENFGETSKRQHNRLIKINRVKDKDDQKGGLTFMITTATTVQEVFVFKGVRVRKRDEA